MRDFKWHDSFVIKDALSICRTASTSEKQATFTSSTQPQALQRLADVMFDCPERPENFKFDVLTPTRKYDSICLTSGGADSTIAWHYSGKPMGLYIDIGQPYAVKEMAALRACKIEHQYIDLRGAHVADKTWKHIIPGRNFLFLSIAAEMVLDNGKIWFAILDGEGADSEKGDKSTRFVNLFMDWYRSVTGRSVYVYTCLARTKPGWLEWMKQIYGGKGVDLIRYHTVTCFSNESGQCGKCQACLRKFLSYLNISMDISKDFNVHPMIGAHDYVLKYKTVLHEALLKGDFTHYSSRRCSEDLSSIGAAERLMML